MSSKEEKAAHEKQQAEDKVALTLAAIFHACSLIGGHNRPIGDSIAAADGLMSTAKGRGIDVTGLLK